MADVTLRSAGPSDAAAIAAIWNPVIRDTLATFTTAEKPAAGIDALLAGKADTGRPFLLAEEKAGRWASRPTRSSATAPVMRAGWNTR